METEGEILKMVSSASVRKRFRSRVKIKIRGGHTLESENTE